jgi:predicted MFS family arabinose efflux permease
MSFPIYPYMVSKFRGGDPREGQLAFGAFRSFNQTLQLIGSLLAGSLVDKIGCKNVILVSFAASVACYVLLAVAFDLPSMYVSQLPALFQHVLLASRGFVSFAVPADQRSISFGRLATSYGVGAIAGPAVGGLLGKYSFSLPAAVSAITCLVAGLAVFRFLPDIHASASRQKEVKDDLLPPPTALSSYLGLLKDPKLTTILLMKLFFLLAVSLHSSTIQMVSGPVFGMDTAAAGGLMSFSAILGTVSQAILVRPALAVFAPSSLTLLAAAILAPSYGTLGGLTAGWQLYLLAVPVSIANTVQNLVSAQVAVELAPASGRGSYIGLEQALASGGRMLAPTLAGWVLKNGGLKGVGIASAGLVGGGVLAQIWGSRRKRGRSGRED